MLFAGKYNNVSNSGCINMVKHMIIICSRYGHGNGVANSRSSDSKGSEMTSCVASKRISVGRRPRAHGSEQGQHMGKPNTQRQSPIIRITLRWVESLARASQESTQASLRALTGKSKKLQSAVQELELSLMLDRKGFWMGYQMG